MSQTDRRLRSITARPTGRIADPPPPPPLAPPVVDAPPIDLPATSSGKLSVRLVCRAARRHWWQALLLWAAGSSGLMALVESTVRPSYDASSTIKIDPVLSRVDGPMVDFEVFKETQARRVTNPDVIASALSAHPELLRQPDLASSREPEAVVRRSIGASVIPGTNLIRVTMTSGSADVAAKVVNAVIEAFLQVAPDADEAEAEADERRQRLAEARQERAEDVRRKRGAVASLVGRAGNVDAGPAIDRHSATIEHYKMLTGQLLQADLDLVDQQSRLDRLRKEPIAPPTAEPSEPDAETIAAFYATPEVAEARARRDRARDDLAQADRNARVANDPLLAAARKKADDLQKQIDVLWARMRPELVRSASPGDTLEAAEARVAGLKSRRALLNDRMEKLNAQTRAAGADELTREFARQDLKRAEAVLDTVTRTLDQVEFEVKKPVARFHQEYRARASNAPVDGRRSQVMAALPLGMFLGVLGLFVMVELRAARVHDPEEMPARLRLQVLGVVPLLPRGRPSSGRPSARSKRHLDQFIQSLDHLRVAICAGPDGRGRTHRSILITSARGGEGKTTLASQLAERCVKTGLLTLLIDADLRNPTLSRMFDLQDGRGLVDVLGGEAMAEEAISVIDGAGGFHFLPAGSPRVDPGRLLNGDRLGRLLAGARESFDIVIVDSPPILPVPDALTIGRWVDGAVLAVRFDDSRYPLVERANRRLAAVGVPVLGAVISGVRRSEAADYGPYDPGYGPIDVSPIEGVS